MAACVGPGKEPDVPRLEFDPPEAPARGPDDAAVRIVEFADFRCGYCARIQPSLTRLLAAYPDDVRLAFVHMPLVTASSAPAAIAAEAARRQGRFWGMHDALFARSDGPLDADTLIDEARALGLDEKRFLADMRDPALAARIRADLRQVERLSIRGTPALLINGRLFVGALPEAQLRRIVAAERDAARDAASEREPGGSHGPQTAR